MKGQMKVKKLNDTGLYISEMDWDNTYICKENPIGNFVMVIEPLSGFDGGIIYFDKKTDGYLIEGEGYILVGRPDEIQKRVRKWKQEYAQKPFRFYYPFVFFRNMVNQNIDFFVIQ